MSGCSNRGRKVPRSGCNSGTKDLSKSTGGTVPPGGQRPAPAAPSRRRLAATVAALLDGPAPAVPEVLDAAGNGEVPRDFFLDFFDGGGAAGSGSAGRALVERSRGGACGGLGTAEAFPVVDRSAASITAKANDCFFMFEN